MAENHYTLELFRQARDFEKLENAFGLGKPTEKDLAMAHFCKGMSEVCMMLAEMHSKEGKKKEAKNP